MRGRLPTLAWAVLAVVFILSMATPALAQSDRGSISGLVKDASACGLLDAAAVVEHPGDRGRGDLRAPGDLLKSHSFDAVGHEGRLSRGRPRKRLQA